MQYPETVVRLRAEVILDAHRAQVRDWGNATETQIEGVQVQRTSSADEPASRGRQSAISTARLLTPKGVDIDLLRTDRVRWDDVTWDVDGRPARHKSPHTGALHHVEVALRAVEG